MKLALATLSAAVAVANAKTLEIKSGSIAADSKLGNKIMSHARSLNQDWDGDFSWVAGYSLKFQGCHHISQWNEEANGEDDVRIMTKRLVRFRLCPTGTCSDSSGSGCDGGYGDYIVDMNIFLQAYMEQVQQQREYECEYTENYVAGCNDNEYCLFDYFVANNMEYCIEENPYNQNNDNEDEYDFEADRYVECANYEFPEWNGNNQNGNNNNNNQNNNNNNNQNWNGEEIEYFVGPYCSEQGGSIFLGVFTDEMCTIFADENGGKYLFKQNAGFDLPYAAESMVGMECMSCKEPNENEQNNNGDDQQDADDVLELCEQLYEQAGKCESAGLSNVAYYPNDGACDYMEGIKIVRSDGMVKSSSSGSNKTAAVFIGIFAVAFVLLGAYVYYLKTKLDRAKINLSE